MICFQTFSSLDGSGRNIHLLQKINFTSSTTEHHLSQMCFFNGWSMFQWSGIPWYLKHRLKPNHIFKRKLNYCTCSKVLKYRHLKQSKLQPKNIITPCTMGPYNLHLLEFFSHILRPKASIVQGFGEATTKCTTTSHCHGTKYPQNAVTSRRRLEDPDLPQSSLELINI